MSRNWKGMIGVISCSQAVVQWITASLSTYKTYTWEVVWLTSFEEGLASFKDGACDIYVLDCQLDTQPGVAWLEEAHRDNATTPVVFLSRKGCLGYETDVFEAGAAAYLIREETQPDVLERTIRYTLAMSRRRAASAALDDAKRLQAEEAVREIEGRYAVAARGANDGLWDWDLHRNEVYYSSRWKEMLGYTEAEISNSPGEWFSRVHVDDQDVLNTEIARHLSGVTQQLEIEFRMRHSNGNYLWFLCRGLAVPNAFGRPNRIAGSLTDINHRKSVEEQLQRDAFFDPLTKLANRLLFMDRLTGAVRRARRRDDYHFAVLFLDLDRFKNVNDGLGHAVGDELLVAFAQRLLHCVREQDTVARLGGDEFAILIEDIADVIDATQVASRIQDTLKVPFQLGTNQIFASVSIGITTSKTTREAPKNFLRDADTAMYQAKNSGRACHVIFHTEMHHNAYHRMQMEMDLRIAIERSEFCLYYQPIIELKSGVIAGFEALIRWQRPDGALISPSQFISMAEETGLIVPMGWWVLEESFRQFSEWVDKHPGCSNMMLSVNLSGRQFAQPDLIQNLDQILKRTRIDPSRIKIEITESMLMGNTASVKKLLHQLKERELQISIDDFGTGYSSLGYLHYFPIDVLKVDRSFVMRMEHDKDKFEIVKTIVTLAHRLNMDVVAEGIENQEHLQRLRELGCEYGQGFYFSKPLHQKAVLPLIQDNPKW